MVEKLEGVQVNVRLDDELMARVAEKLRRMAEKTPGVTRAHAIRELLVTGLKADGL